MLKTTASFLILSSILFSLKAQMHRDEFPLTREYKKGGFYLTPLATVSIGNKELGSYSIADTTYNYEVVGRGKWAYGLEVGWYHSFKEPRLIYFIEAGLSYRVFKGAAEHEGTLSNPTGSALFKSDNTYSNQYLVASVRATNAKQWGKKSFFSTSLGANFNYQIAESYDRSSFYPLDDEEFLNETSLQLHLQIGVGFRVNKTLIIMPTLESPLLSILPTDGGVNPAFPFFTANYQPFIIGLRFMFIREDPMNCNAPVFQGLPN